MKKTVLTIALFGTVLLSSCTASRVISGAGVADSKGGKRVQASVENTNFLGLSPWEVDQLDALNADLVNQCNGSGITGVTTHLDGITLPLMDIQTITSTGYCK